MSTNFFTNRGDNSLLKKFNGVFEKIASLYAFHAVVGYFRASGCFAIREHLMRLGEVKNKRGLICEEVEEMILFFMQCGLNEQDIREVENWYARRYPRLVAAQKENLRKLGKSDDYVELYGEVGERTEM